MVSESQAEELRLDAGGKDKNFKIFLNKVAFKE